MIKNHSKFTDKQIKQIDEYEANSTFRLQMGQNKLKEFVGWVFTLMPAIAPLPNMVKLTGAICVALGNTWGAFWTAFLICVAIELMLFGVSEQLNGVIDKWLRANGKDKGLYQVPLWITGIGATFIVIIMLSLVYTYEVNIENGKWTSMALPMISVLSVGFMGVRSYLNIVESAKEDEAHYNDELLLTQKQVEELTEQSTEQTNTITVLKEEIETLNAEHKRLNGTLNIVEHERNNLGVELSELRGELVQYTEKLRNNDIEHERLNVEHERLNSELSVERERVRTLEHQLNTPVEHLVHTRSFNGVQHMSNGSSTTDERRGELLNILSNEYANTNVSDLNKTTLGQRLNTSHTTITRDLKFLEKKGMIHLNGVVEVIEQ